MSDTNDYINRGKAINAVHQRIKQIGYDHDPYVLSICQAVRDVPATDVVEVVRCKECKFLSHFTDGHLECRLLYDLRPVPCTYVTMQENDFCSYGERREVTE